MVLSLGQAIDLRMVLTPLEYYRDGSTSQIASMGQRRDEESSNDSSRQKPPFGEAL